MRAALSLLLALTLVLATPATAQISLLGLKNSLVQFALERISVPGEFEVRADGVEEPEDGVTSLVGVTISDGDGVWLRIAEARLNWTPSRILRGELAIAFAGLQDVDLLRLPNAPAADASEEEDEEEGDPFAWPRSPIALDIQDLRLDRVRIAPGVIAAQGLAFSARGAARDEGDVQSAELSLTREDDVSGRIRLEYRRTFDEPRLKLFLDAAEAPGGIVAELGGLPDDSASRVRLSADGPLTAWNMTLDAESDGVLRATGLARFDATARLDVQAGLTLTPGDRLEPRLRELLAPRARLDFAAREGEDGIVVIERGDFASPFLTLSAEGTHDRATTRSDVALRLDAQGELSRLTPGLTFGGLSFEGRATGPFEALTGEGALRLAGFDAGVAGARSAALDGRVTLTDGRIDAALTGGLEGLRLDRLGPDLLGSAQLVLRGAFQEGVARLQQLELTTTPLQLTATGEAALTEGRADLTFTAAAPDLGPVARAYDAPVDGALRWSGEATGPFDALVVDGSAQIDGLAWDGTLLGDVRAEHVLTLDQTPGGRLSLTADGPAFGNASADLEAELNGDVVDLSRLALDALGATLNGSGQVDLAGPWAEGRFTLSAPDLSSLSPLTQRLDLPPASGAIDADIEAFRDDGGQAARGTLTVAGFEGFGARAARADVTFDAVDLLGDPLGEARVAARALGYDDATVERIDAALTATRGEGRATDLNLRFGLESLAAGDAGGLGALVGEATVRDAMGDPSVTMEAAASRIAAAGAATVAEATLTLDAAGLRGEAPAGTAAAELRGISAGGIAAPMATLTAALTPEGRLDAAFGVPEAAGDGLSARGVRMTAAADDALTDARVVDVALGAESVVAGPARLNALSASLRGPMSALSLNADVRGRLRLDGQAPQPLSLALAAQADLSAPEAPQGRVDAFVASVGPMRARLADPLTFGPAEGGGTALRGLDLRIPGGRLQGEGAAHPDGFAADLRAVLSDPPSLAAALAPLGASLPLETGRIALNVDADTRPQAARADIRLTGRDLRLPDMGEELPGLSLDARGDWNGARLALDAAAAGDFGEPLEVSVVLPLRAQPGGVPALQGDGPLAGGVRWQGRVERLWAFVPAPDHLLSGDLNLNLAFDGTPDTPRLAGEVAVGDGRYENLETGTILTDLTVRSALAPDGGFAVDLEADDGAEGGIAVRAAIAPGGDLDARVTADEAVLVRREDVVARLSADIAAVGDESGLAVTGRVDIGRAEVRLVEALPPSIADLGDIRFKGETRPEPPPPAGRAVTLDIAVNAPGGIFVRGRGLDSEWETALTISGSAAAPRIVGAVERVRGQLDFLGREFDLVTGRISFSGGEVIDPSINVSLEHERDGFTGKIQARGTASAPEIVFASTPAVPEGEVLPRTIFGEDSQSLSATDALLLANAVRTLLSGGEGLGGGLRSAAGLDVLRIDESDSGGAQVTAGRNVADGVFVGVNQPLDGGSASVEVEVEVFSTDDYGTGVVGAETGSEDGSTFGAGWRIDF